MHWNQTIAVDMEYSRWGELGQGSYLIRVGNTSLVLVSVSVSVRRVLVIVAAECVAVMLFTGRARKGFGSGPGGA